MASKDKEKERKRINLLILFLAACATEYNKEYQSRDFFIDSTL
jgi:hypothetical protein